MEAGKNTGVGVQVDEKSGLTAKKTIGTPGTSGVAHAQMSHLLDEAMEIEGRKEIYR